MFVRFKMTIAVAAFAVLTTTPGSVAAQSILGAEAVAPDVQLQLSSPIPKQNPKTVSNAISRFLRSLNASNAYNSRHQYPRSIGDKMDRGIVKTLAPELLPISTPKTTGFQVEPFPAAGPDQDTSEQKLLSFKVNEPTEPEQSQEETVVSLNEPETAPVTDSDIGEASLDF